MTPFNHQFLKSPVSDSEIEEREFAEAANCQVIADEESRLSFCGDLESLAGLPDGLKESLRLGPRIVAFDLESVLVPEIWHTVAQVTGIRKLALTTRDIADYDLLMCERIRLCRANGLTLARLREIVGNMVALPGAVELLAWVQERMLAVIISDTYHELAAPIVEKLGCPLMICNGLTVDEGNYISGHHPHFLESKAGAVAHFQHMGFQILAVGDSFNDLAMLQAADAGVLFRPCPGLKESVSELPIALSLQELQAALQEWLAEAPAMAVAPS